jgi:hypothetical protein
VVGVGGGAAGHHAAQVAGHHDVGVRAADAELGAVPKGIDAAGPHGADPAGQTQIAKAALGLLGLVPLPDGLQTFLLGFLFEGQGVGLDGDGRGDCLGFFISIMKFSQK